jgi:uncharacterized protein YndB with AHSA1/START domain
MPAGKHAVLREHDGRWALVFERTLAQPPERVWRALIERNELAQWHPTPFELRPGTPTPGARISFVGVDGGPSMPDGELLEYDPPRALAYTWGEDELRWELGDHDGGCTLRLTHVFDDRLKALADSLQRTPRPRRGSLPDGWSELNSDYQRRFGIAPGQATPPPG